MIIRRVAMAMVATAVAAAGSQYQLAQASPGGSAAPAVGPAMTRVPIAAPTRVPVTAARTAVAAPAWVKVGKKSKTSLKVRWAKVPGASGYVVYRWDSQKKRYASVKTLTKASATSWVDNKRKTGKKYSYKVAAYRLVGGKKKVGPQSYWVSAVPHKKNAKVVNAGRLLTPRNHVGFLSTLRLLRDPREQQNSCPFYTSGTCVLPSSASKAENKRVVDSTVRFTMLSGEGVVRATSDGVVYGLKLGKAKFRLIAHNGTMETLTVTVRDYVHDPFVSTGDHLDPEERILLKELRKQVQEVAFQAEQNTLKDRSFAGGTFLHNERGELTCVVRAEGAKDKPCSRQPPKALATAIDTLLSAFSHPMEVTISVSQSRKGPNSLVVRYQYWLAPERSGRGKTLSYDPYEAGIACCACVTWHVADAWRLSMY